MRPFIGRPTGRGGPKTFKQHRLGAIFPETSEKELKELADDIAKNGLIDDIDLYEDQILDGWNRYLACRRVGVAPRFRVFNGDDALSFVINRNIRRRHLTPSQRAFAAARGCNLPKGWNQHGHEGLPVGRAASLFGVGARSVERAKKVLTGGIPELIDAVETGHISLSHAELISELFPDGQRASKLDNWHLPASAPSPPNTPTSAAAPESLKLKDSEPADQEPDPASGIAASETDCSTGSTDDMATAVEEVLSSLEAQHTVPAATMEGLGSSAFALARGHQALRKILRKMAQK